MQTCKFLSLKFFWSLLKTSLTLFQVVLPAKPELQRQRADNTGQWAGVPGLSWNSMRRAQVWYSHLIRRIFEILASVISTVCFDLTWLAHLWGCLTWILTLWFSIIILSDFIRTVMLSREIQRLAALLLVISQVQKKLTLKEKSVAYMCRSNDYRLLVSKEWNTLPICFQASSLSKVWERTVLLNPMSGSLDAKIKSRGAETKVNHKSNPD